VSIEINDYKPIYHDFSKSRSISFDIETCDPGLKTIGPGVFRRESYILGCALADETGKAEYYDFRDNPKNLAFVKSVLEGNSIKIAHNGKYDRLFLKHKARINVNIEKRNFDTLLADYVLNENASHKLDNVLARYVNKNKIQTDVTNLKDYPISHVAKYAIGDIKHLLDVANKQTALIQKQNLNDVFKMEIDLIEPIMLMYENGVCIDVEKLKRTKQSLESIFYKKKKAFLQKYGFDFRKSLYIADYIKNKCDIDIPDFLRYTEKGNETTNQYVIQYLKNNSKDLVYRIIQDLRKNDFLINTVLKNFAQCELNGKLHCDFITFGARTGRFSCHAPNLQNVPKRDEEAKKITRGLFIPYPGHKWFCGDYSQVEYRIMALFGFGPGSDAIKKAYKTDPNTDYHQMIMDLTGFKRSDAKRLNFGCGYGMGYETCAKLFGWSVKKAEDFVNLYHQKVPFIRYTTNMVKRRLDQRGFVTSISGRRHRKVGFIPAHTYYNKVIQGSAADIIKKALVDCYQAGIFSVLKPHLTIHDEIDFSTKQNKESLDAIKEMKHICENVYADRRDIPLRFDLEIGDNWSHLKDFDEQEFLNGTQK
jgi:DNA polymerase-1